MDTDTAVMTEATPQEWDEIVDRAARFHLGMSGAEFRERLEAGEFADPDAGPDGLMAVLALFPAAA